MTRLTQSQQLLWAGQKRFPTDPLYNMALAFTIEGPLDKERFIKANEELVKLCETFRTVVREADGVPFRIILDGSDTSLAFVDFREFTNPDQAAKTWLEGRANRPFSLEDSLTDQALLCLSETRFIWYLNQHHLITDGTTSGIVFDAMRRLYRSESVSLPSFDAYAAFEATASSNKAQAYWDNLLASPSPTPVLLYGRSLVTETVTSVRKVISLGQERSEKLRQLALSPELRGFTDDLSLFQFLASLLFTFLHRQTGETHLSIATPTHNRPTPAFKRTPGVFIEVFPLEIQFSQGASFLDIHQAVRNEVLTYLTHAQGGQSRAELAARSQILLNVVNASFGTFDDMPVHTEWLHSGCGDRQHALRLAVYDFDQQGDFSFLFDFNNDAFTHQEQAWTIDHFFQLINATLTDPSQTIGRIDLLNASERETLLTSWNQTSKTIDRDTTIIDVFEEQRWSHPDRIALVGPCVYDSAHCHFSYETLDQRANQLANHLADAGIHRGDHVAILLEPSIEWVVSMLAILKTGAAYFPTSTEEPPERLAWLIEDTACKLTITRHGLADQLPTFARKVLLDLEEGAIASAPDIAPPRESTAEDHFYLISTSGSTGQPKAVCGTHVSLINLLSDFENRSPLAEEAKTTWWTSPTFDVSLYEIWSALLYGRTLHIIPPSDRANADKVLTLLEDKGIHSAYLPAFMLPDLAVSLEKGQFASSPWQRLLVGVEPIQESLLRKILSHLPHLKIINGYGPAEATVCCTLYDVERDSTNLGVTPIGRPLQNTSVYVLDSHDMPVPIGAPGELLVGGECLALGYWNRPELNSSRFIPNPFAQDPSSALYRTGDRVRYLSTGDLQFLGRVDGQLKIRGHRIEPGEIIVALEKHAAVRQAALRLWSPNRLVAYVSTLTSVDSNTLRSHLEATLPRYMIPAQIVVLETLPTNINGKIDVQALPEPERTVSEERPTSEIERDLVTIWAQVFGIEHVGIHENFFDLGGDSIISIRIVAQANRVGIRLTPNQLFDHQTIASLAQAAKPTATAEQPLASHQSGPVPLNAIQHWFFAQNFAQPGVFNHQVTLSLPHHVDRATIETRLRRLINRHDAFRLIFQNGEQSLIESAPKISLRSLPDVESASTALNQPFLLEQAPLFRAALVGPSTLILVAHHLIVDGVSWAILLDELLHPDAPSLPPIGFGTWCHHLDQAAANGAFRDEIAYWKAHDTHNPTGLPLDTSAGSPAENLEASRAVITSTIPAASLAKAPAPIQEILITSVASAISAWTQQPHVRMDIEGHGRETALIDLDISTSLGWFTSLYPLTIPVHPRATPKARLATVSERMHSLPRHGAAYGILTQSDTKSGLTPCASEILFNYLGHVDGEPIRLIRHPDNQRSYLLEIDAIISRGNLEINWHYSDRLHAHATVQRLADDSLACLQAIVSEGDKPTASTIDTKTMSKLANLLEKIDTAT